MSLLCKIGRLRRPLLAVAAAACVLATAGLTGPAKAQYYPYYAGYCDPYYYPMAAVMVIRTTLMATGIRTPGAFRSPWGLASASATASITASSMAAFITRAFMAVSMAVSAAGTADRHR